ncbi:AFG2-interacting ribosome maturation factor-like [Diadema antillarum]|uniref:AFG2-interacting ribosome maturation factor-like n=1 Tax=Diadema antillarum TaxID=105358 RepID=UPI003A8390F5
MANSAKFTVTLHTQLRKSFRNVQSCWMNWKDNLKKGEEYIKAITNLSEQFHCVLRVSQSQSSNCALVHRFSSILQQLQCKLIQEFELIVHKLVENIAEMQTISNKIHQQYVNAMSAYKKCNQHLPVPEACCGSATWPALADMLEWLLDLDYMFQYLYENQREVFDTIDYSQEERMQSLLARWTSGHSEVAESVENVLAHVSFFMADG